MLPLNLSKTEIQRLNYERYHYPDPLVQKRIQAVYLIHNAITGFFQTINQEYNDDLKNLLTLKFQFFQNQNAEIYPK